MNQKTLICTACLLFFTFCTLPLLKPSPLVNLFNFSIFIYFSIYLQAPISLWNSSFYLPLFNRLRTSLSDLLIGSREEVCLVLFQTISGCWPVDTDAPPRPSWIVNSNASLNPLVLPKQSFLALFLPSFLPHAVFVTISNKYLAQRTSYCRFGSQTSPPLYNI